jgi:hypothetical protein
MTLGSKGVMPDFIRHDLHVLIRFFFLNYLSCDLRKTNRGEIPGGHAKLQQILYPEKYLFLDVDK